VASDRTTIMDDAFPAPGGRRPDAAVHGPANVADSSGGDLRIGPYKLLGQLGEGGFGLVYVAEQEQPVRRRVALKVLKPGMDSRTIIARFEAERQALAVMDHPCVAKVFDAGTTDRGLPYFAMEYVQGEAITTFCDRRKDTVRDRLELFIRVCDAVQHAHQKGIVHRDIKPSNVMVTMSDGKPLPKVIDFGIAKAMSGSLTDRTLYTERGQMIGTPEYMSPEQADNSGLDIDTRTDVYSLGVLLYELLTGSLPFDSKRLRSATFADVVKIIREYEPPRPSQRLSKMSQAEREFKTKASAKRSTSNGGPTSVGTPSWQGSFTQSGGEDGSDAESPALSMLDLAFKRKTDPPSMMKSLRGDLDWIVMRAMEKDRERRYESPAALAADVRRHLNNEPVAAGPPSITYRLSKFARRNTLALAAGSLVFLALTGGLAFASYAFVQADRERAVAIKAGNTAKKEAAKALAVSKFLEEMLSGADPNEAQGKELTVREMVDRSVKKIDNGGFKDQPEVEASVRAAVAVVYQSLGETDTAVKQMRAALAISEKTYGPDTEAVASNQHDLGTMLLETGEMSEGERLFAAALVTRRKITDLTNNDQLSELGSSINSMAACYQEQDKLDLAEPLYREALAIERKVHPEGHARLALCLNNLGMLMVAQGKPDDGLLMLRESMDMRKRVLGETHPDYAQAVNNFGGLMMGMKNFAEAERCFRESVAIRKKILPLDHPDLASNINNIGGALYMQGKLAEAEPFVREALELRRKTLSPSHPNITGSVRNLGRILLELDRRDEAEKLLLDAYAAMKANSETPPSVLASTADELASMYEKFKQPDKAATWKALGTLAKSQSLAPK